MISGSTAERDQRQAPVHLQHDEQNADEHEHVFKDRHHAGGEHFVERVHVGGDAGDQTADRVAVEEADVHALQVAKDLAAQVKHDLLPGPLHEVGLQEFQEESKNQQADVHAADLRDADQRLRAQEAVEKAVAARRVGRQVLVHGDLGEVGADHVGGGFQHDGRQRKRHLPFVRPQVAQQPLHQPAVIGLSQDLFFVDVGRHLPLGYQTRWGRLRMEKVGRRKAQGTRRKAGGLG